MDVSIRQYRLKTDRLSAAERRIRKVALIPQLTIIVIVLVVSAVLAAHYAENTRNALTFGLFVAVFLTYIAFASPRRMHRRLTKCWETYVLEIGPDYLLRRQADTPDVRIAFSEVQRVEPSSGVSLRVIGVNKFQMIGIPEGIEHFDEVMVTITALAPVTAPRSNRALRINALTGFGFAGYMVMLWSRSPWVVVPLAAALSALLIWVVVFMQRSPNVARQSRRTAWLYLLGILTCGLKVLATIGPMSWR
jgi:hypothetical protein